MLSTSLASRNDGQEQERCCSAMQWSNPRSAGKIGDATTVGGIKERQVRVTIDDELVHILIRRCFKQAFTSASASATMTNKQQSRLTGEIAEISGRVQVLRMRLRVQAAVPRAAMSAHNSPRASKAYLLLPSCGLTAGINRAQRLVTNVKSSASKQRTRVDLIEVLNGARHGARGQASVTKPHDCTCHSSSSRQIRQ